MKLIIVTSIREDKDTVISFFDVARIPIFSITDTTGHKKYQPSNLPDNWFGKVGDAFESLVFFSFSIEEQADRLLALISEHNMASKSNFPLHAFIMPVEKATEF